MQILAILHAICNNYTTSHKLIIATTTKNLIISNRQQTLEVNDEWYINESMKIKMKNMLYIYTVIFPSCISHAFLRPLAL